ncbi:MAG: AAA family ATPase [Chitinispirillia bacterium]|nr:AAA family ATPase [Chitinispirillia bacterium]
MYRTAIKALIEWKFSVIKKPLIFLGARQVGKTWLLKEFGRTEFRQMLYINFEEKDAPREIFHENFNLKQLFAPLYQTTAKRSG